jgi:hypothetical protein
MAPTISFDKTCVTIPYLQMRFICLAQLILQFDHPNKSDEYNKL